MNKILLRIGLSSMLVLTLQFVQAQSGVGIGTSNPNPNAVLDIVSSSNDKGILIPRLTTAQRTAMNTSLSTNENGLMVFDSGLDGFYFWNGIGWNSVTVVQDLRLTGNTLTITNNGSATDIDLAPFSGSNTDNQTLSIAGTNLTITGGNTLDLAPIQDGVDDADNDPTNEIELPATASTNDVLVWNGSSWVAGTDQTVDGDASSINEIQNLTSVLGQGTSAGNSKITNLASPTLAQDAATKSYVDGINVNDADADPTNEIQDLQLAGNILTITNKALPTSIDLSAFTGTNTDNQTLSLAGTNLTITGGNTLDLASIQDGVDDADADPTNEIQDLQLAGNILTITNNGSPTTIDLSVIQDGYEANTDNQNLGATTSGTNRTVTITGGTNATFSIADNDNSATNEIQDLSSSASGTNRTVAITGGTNATFSVADNDNSTTNEIQDLQLVGADLTITNNGSPTTIDLSVIQDGYEANTDNQNLGVSTSGTNRTVTITGGTNATFSVADNDNSTFNEIQTITKTGVTVTLSNGGGSFNVNDADASTSNELQTISKTGSTVTLSNGGGSFTDAVNDADASTTNEIQTLAEVLAEGNSAGNRRITNLLSPINPNDAARRAYVDAQDHSDNQTLSVSGSTLTIAGGNSVTLPSSSPTQDAFKAYLSGNLSVSSGGGAIDFDVVDYDVTGSGTYGGGKYSPPVNGIYAFTGVFDMQMVEASSFAIIVTVDGVSRYSMKARTSNGGGSFIGFGFSTELKLNAGETVQFELSSPNSHTLFGGTEFRSHISGRLIIEL